MDVKRTRRDLRASRRWWFRRTGKNTNEATEICYWCMVKTLAQAPLYCLSVWSTEWFTQARRRGHAGTLQGHPVQPGMFSFKRFLNPAESFPCRYWAASFVRLSAKLRMISTRKVIQTPWTSCINDRRRWSSSRLRNASEQDWLGFCRHFSLIS